MAAAGVVVLFLVVLAVPVLLYMLIERETSDPEIVDRSEAERLARERGGRPGEQRRDDEGPDTDSESGADSEWGSRSRTRK